MRRKTFKELGTPTVQAKALANQVLELPATELLERARAERERLIEAGEIDEVGDNQPEQAPRCNDSLIGTQLEVRWRYWRPAKEGERGKKKQEYIWCEGEIVAVAAAESVKITPKIKDLAGETAVRVKWPKDEDFERRFQELQEQNTAETTPNAESGDISDCQSDYSELSGYSSSNENLR